MHKPSHNFLSRPVRLILMAVLVIAVIIIVVATTSLKEKFESWQPAEEKPELSEPFHAAQMLIGDWRADKGIQEVFERWSENADGGLSGQGVAVLNGAETLFVEQFTITPTDSGVFYTAESDMADVIVPFRLTVFTENSLMFENPEHEWPRRIIYKLLTEDSLHAHIEGVSGDRHLEADIFFERTD